MVGQCLLCVTENCAIIWLWIRSIEVDRFVWVLNLDLERKWGVLIVSWCVCSVKNKSLSLNELLIR